MTRPVSRRCASSSPIPPRRSTTTAPQILAALEFACLDILGQAWGVPVCDILGGRLRDAVPFASYCFYRYPNPKNRRGRGPHHRPVDRLRQGHESEVRLHHPQDQGPASSTPDHELELYRAVAQSIPGDSFRFDCNAVWSTEQAIRFGQGIEDLRNDYLEDPVYGLNGMRRVRQMVRIPLATNTVVVNFEQLAANILDTAVDVILLDTTFWGGIRACVKAAGVCETFQIGVAVHSSGELGNSARVDAPPRRRDPQSLLRRRRSLPSPRPTTSSSADPCRTSTAAIAVPTAPRPGRQTRPRQTGRIRRTVPTARRLSL